MNRTIAALAVAALVAAAAIPALAQGVGPGPGRAQPPAVQPQAAPLPIDQAIARARQYLNAVGNANLAPVEIIEFSAVYYVVVADRTTKAAAFALLVDRVSGNVSREMGPPRMWNTAYGWPAGSVAGMMGPAAGMMGPGAGAGRMGRHPLGQGLMGPVGPGAGRRMMGPQGGPGTWVAPGAPAPRAPQAAPAVPLDEPRAREALRAWVAQAFPGATIGRVVAYPGFFTYRLERDGRTFALASVHAGSGQVWYAWRYGAFVRDQEIR
ncbi:MAG: hypothetical protein QN137_12410 [Armatimonadota bacterium]|nr:hypothetical protein [Armatimonadota bacterium]